MTDLESLCEVLSYILSNFPDSPLQGVMLGCISLLLWRWVWSCDLFCPVKIQQYVFCFFFLLEALRVICNFPFYSPLRENREGGRWIFPLSRSLSRETRAKPPSSPMMDR